MVYSWYSIDRHVTTDDWYTSGRFLLFDCLLTVFLRMVHCTNRQKQSKDSQNSKNHHWCTNRHMSTQSAEYTKPRKRRYLARPPSHVPGQWPQPVARGQGCLYVSTWTSMRLAPVRCRVLLHSLLPTDDACSSSSLSTTVIKFSIFSDPTRKLSALPPELRRIR